MVDGFPLTFPCIVLPLQKDILLYSSVRVGSPAGRVAAGWTHSCNWVSFAPEDVTEAHLKAMPLLVTSVLSICDVFHYRAPPLPIRCSILPGGKQIDR